MLRTTRAFTLVAVGVLLVTSCGQAPAGQKVSADSGARLVGGTVRKDVPYVPTPDKVVAEMLRLGKVGKGDRLYDLGCGDGRIVITAAKQFGTRGVGVDIDPKRIEESNANARRAGVTDLVRFETGDLFKMDFKDATVVTLYLLPSVNLRLRPRLLDELQPGTRIVSHAFDMNDWRPDQETQVDGRYRLYLWTIPAKVAGEWRPTAPGSTLTLRQMFQDVNGSLKIGDRQLPIREGRLQGDRLTFTAGEGAAGVQFTGRVQGNSLKGELERREGGQVTREPWEATRAAAPAR